jgi:hypothetical protein
MPRRNRRAPHPFGDGAVAVLEKRVRRGTWTRPHCEQAGKAIYLTEEEARRDILALTLYSTAANVPVRVYGCQHGGHFHITSRSAWRVPS